MRVLIGGFLAMLFACSAGAHETPSFDCAMARTPDEKLICGDDLLAHADRSLAGFYRMLRNGLGPNSRDVVKDDQRQWIQHRNRSCGVRRDTVVDGADREVYLRCFRRSYAERAEDLISKVTGIPIEQADFDQLHGSAESGNADAEAVLGYILSEGNGADLGSRRWRDPAESQKWLKKAAADGQLLARDDFERILTDSQPAAGENDGCADSVTGLSEEEAAKILPLLEIDGRQDLVGFTCRDPGNRNHLIVGTSIGANLGDVYSVILSGGAPVVKALDHGQYHALDMVRDKSGTPFLLLAGLYMHQGPMLTWHMLVNIRTGKIKRLEEVAEDGGEGWCGTENLPDAGRLTYAKERRPDGLYDLVYRLETMNCKDKKITRKIVRFIPTGEGFVS